eukprot:gb/GECH01009122.1/.p1 GENE.gb/GECH01009122.1/~~gb/GECH01009122.1/.p1  ORF type:complete len:359 (+),score=34.16 gb/GECH01009122.1/:1-1077(+)
MSERSRVKFFNEPCITSKKKNTVVKNDMNHVKNVKILVLGERNVGKSSLIKTLETGSFPSSELPTITNVTRLRKTIHHQTYQISLWDTPGGVQHEELLRPLRPFSYPHTIVFLLVFDLNEQKSLDKLKQRWIQASDSIRHKHPVIVWGNKFDRILREEPQIHWIRNQDNFSFSSLNNFFSHVLKSSLSFLGPNDNISHRSKNVMKQLPEDILTHVISYCNITDVNRFCAVDWRWYRCLANDTLWKQLLSIQLINKYSGIPFHHRQQKHLLQQQEYLHVINNHVIPIDGLEMHFLPGSMLPAHRIRPATFRHFSEARGGVQVAQDIGATLYVEGSAFTRENVDHCWDAIAALVHHQLGS